MKTKIILLLAISAVITLSFTYASVNTDKKYEIKSNSESISSAPVGGLVSEDKL